MSNQSTSLAKTFTQSGAAGLFICLMFLFGIYIFLDFKQDNNHIAHQTQSDIMLNETLRDMTGVLSEIKTIINK